MIGHQHIGVHRTTELTRELAQVVQTKAVVLLSEEQALRLLPRWMRCSGAPAKAILGRRGIEK